MGIDEGSIIRLENADKELESFSSMWHDSIQQDLLVPTFCEIVELENKDVVKITVASDGTNYETMHSLQQELTFTDAEAIFKEQNLKLGEVQMH